MNTVRKEFDFTDNDSEQTKFDCLGGNVGNIVFCNAIKEQIKFDGEGTYFDEGADDTNRIYVWPCSSFLNYKDTWIEGHIETLERRKDMKIVPVGLGAQTGLNGTVKEVVGKLSDRQKRFFAMLAERCNTIGVRGEFTAECLSELGIKNVEIIGCPSVFKYINTEYKKLDLPTSDKAVLTVSPGRGMATGRCISIGEKAKADWVIQTMTEKVDRGPRSMIDWMKDYFRFSGLSHSNISDYQRDYAKNVYSYKEWNELLSSGYTFAYGLRFHGNMMAFRNGIPTLWIVHDMRTEELTKTLSLPAVSVKSEKFKRAKTIEHLIEACDYSEFYSKYNDNRARYLKFMAQNGITQNYFS